MKPILNKHLKRCKKYIVFCFAVAATFLTNISMAQKVLSLEEAKQLALTRNNNLKIAQQNINAAKAQKAQADAAGKPNLSGTVNAFYFGDPINNLLPEYGVSPGVGVSQAIYSGGRTKLNKEAATKNVEIQETQKVQTTADVLLNTETAYWQVVSANERVKLQEQYEKQLDTLLVYFANQYAAGITYKNDVLRAKVQLNDNALNLTNAKDALVLAKMQLAQLAGIADSIDFTVADSVMGSFNTINMDTSMEATITGLPEVVRQQKSVEASAIQERILKADMKPSINLNANGVTAFGKQGINPGNNSNAMASYYAFLGVNIPLFDWGARKQRVKQQQYITAAQQYQLKETKEQMSLQIEQAYTQLNESAKRIALSGASLEQAGENVRLSNDRLKAGTITGRDVLDAQTLWQQAYNNIIDAKIQYKINEARYKRAIGELK